MVNVPTVVLGKTQSGKTRKAFDLAMAHDGPVIFCNVQWRNYRTMAVTYELRQVVAHLRQGSMSEGPVRVDYRLDGYDHIDRLIDYLLGVHREGHVQGVVVPTVLVVFDEVWRVAPRWADASNPAVRVFTEGLQHGVVGMAISQWASQTSRLILGNAYEWYFFALWPADVDLLARDYRMEVPDSTWAQIREHSCGDKCAVPASHRYWRYTGDWLRGDADGREERIEPEPQPPREGHARSHTTHRNAPDPDPDSDPEEG